MCKSGTGSQKRVPGCQGGRKGLYYITLKKQSCDQEEHFLDNGRRSDDRETNLG